MKVKMKVYGWVDYKEFFCIIRRRAIGRVNNFLPLLWRETKWSVASFLNRLCPYCEECNSFANPTQCKLFYKDVSMRVRKHSCYLKQSKTDLTVRVLNFLNYRLEKSFGVDPEPRAYGSYKGKIFRCKD